MPDRTRLRTTWDGLFISEEAPHGVTVVVLRRGVGDIGDDTEYLVLRRAGAVRIEGDWVWGPPAGVRLPGEDVDACAARELDDRTGLRLPVHRVTGEPAWAVYWAEAPHGAPITLSIDHDLSEWVSLDEAVRRCRPDLVGDQFATLAAVAAA